MSFYYALIDRYSTHRFAPLEAFFQKKEFSAEPQQNPLEKRVFELFVALDNRCYRLSFPLSANLGVPILSSAKQQKNMTDRRHPWVLLHHQVQNPSGIESDRSPNNLGGRGDHYDLMLSPPGVGLLWTWAISVNPLDQVLPLECAAERLSDHRRVYLEYEGPISGDRGQVQQAATGSFEVITWSDQQVEVRIGLDGVNHQDDSFLISLTRRADAWQLCWSNFE